MNIRIQVDGFEQLAELLRGIERGKDEFEKKALIASADVLAARVAAMPSPRSAHKDTGPKGHILDNVRWKEPEVYGTGWSIVSGPQIKYRAGFAYALPLEEGTRRTRAQPFLIPTFNATADEQLDAMMAEVRKGLGVK